jgi:hypothetical protein
MKILIINFLNNFEINDYNITYHRLRSATPEAILKPPMITAMIAHAARTKITTIFFFEKGKVYCDRNFQSYFLW